MMISNFRFPRLESHTHGAIDPDKTFEERKIVIIFLPTYLNMCLGCSKEPSH